jgi:NAD(P)-dependent dehydrogenase (short-subunit alcohol dehydrogenase family)
VDQVFVGKVALVTGAAAGIGYATAKMFADAGASVALLDANGEAVGKAVESLRDGGHKAVALKCDVSNEQQVKASVERTVSTFGRLDMACNNAAKGIRVKVVCPGAVMTPMLERAIASYPESMKAVIESIPLGRLGNPEEVDSAVIWLSSPHASFAVGSVVVIDGGYTTR